MHQCKSWKTRVPYWRWRWLLLLNAVAPLLSHAADDDVVTATNNNVVNPSVSYEYGSNSNLLGLPNSAAAQAMGAGSSLSDTWQNWRAGIEIDEKYSLQELLFNASVARTDFNRLQQLDHDDKNANLTWNWSAGPVLTGQAGFTYQNDLTPYIDFHLLALNMRTQSSEFASVAWMLTPSWRLRAGYTNYHLDYALPAQQAADRTEGRTILGVDYLAASGSSAGLQVQYIDAYFPVPLIDDGVAIRNNYTQDEAKLKVDWLTTPITQIHFLGGWVRRDYEIDSARNYSGFNWRTSVDWQPTDGLGFTAGIWKEIDSVDDLTAAYSVNHGIDAEAKWKISDKMKLEGKYQYIRENFGANQFVGSVPFESGDVRLASLVGTYNVTRKFQLIANLARVIQNQCGPSTGFSGNSIALQARYNFGL